MYWSISFDSAPGGLSATIYVDIDETSSGGGDTGLYFLLGAGHSFAMNHDVFTGLDLSATVGFVNGGFTQFYYGIDDGGPHDASITASVPIAINDNWSASAFLTYSGLLGDGIRASQFQDPREATRPTGASYADTVGVALASVWVSEGFLTFGSRKVHLVKRSRSSEEEHVH